MARKAPKPIAPTKTSLARNKPKVAPRTIFYIYSEGKLTEPDYITNFYQSICDRKKVVLAPIVKAAGVPLTLVKNCVEKKAELSRAAKRNSFEKNNVLWAVFDVDIHPNLDEAIALAEANEIKYIISNPCIEVWGLMHLNVFERPSTRHEAQALLSKAMPGYHHDDCPILPWKLCKDNVGKAINNSIKGLERRAEEGKKFPLGNPSTNFHELLTSMRGDEEDKITISKKGT